MIYESPNQMYDRLEDFSVLSGLGSLASLGNGGKLVSTTGGAVATALPGVLVGTNVIAATSLAVPLIGAAIAGVTFAITAWVNRKGPKQKIYTTEIVNEAELLMQDNLRAFRSSSKNSLEKAQAIANFQDVWSRVVLSCNVPELGNPGQNCINDRKRGSSKGYDWFSLYLDPIEQTQVQESKQTFGTNNSVDDLIGSANEFAEQVFSGGFDFKKLLIPIAILGGLYYASEQF